jgi:hypothetical protein
MKTQLHEQLSPSDAEVILLRLPERIRTALIVRGASPVENRATEIEYLIPQVGGYANEAVVEMAFA